MDIDYIIKVSGVATTTPLHTLIGWITPNY